MKIHDHFNLFKVNLNKPTKEKESILRTSSFCALEVAGQQMERCGQCLALRVAHQGRGKKIRAVEEEDGRDVAPQLT